MQTEIAYAAAMEPKTMLDRAFEAFHLANPRVWELFVRFTFEAIDAGHKNYSARAIAHRIRWHTTVETTDTDYKINNNHVRRYALKFMREYPEHGGFFRTREPHGGGGA
jgi:hypothetical protein